MIFKQWICFLLLLIFVSTGNLSAQALTIKQNPAAKEVEFSNTAIKGKIEYGSKSVITQLLVNNVEVIQDASGIYTKQQTPTGATSSLKLDSDPKVVISNNTLTLSGIKYGAIEETWIFSGDKSGIHWDIIRETRKPQNAVEISSPLFHFKNMSLWEGAYQDYGGLAWFYLFNKPLDTYGVNSSEARFWNSKTGIGLKISINAPQQSVAMTYSRTKNEQLSYRVSVADSALVPRYDSGTNRRLFLRGRDDVWQFQSYPAASRRQRISLSYFDTHKTFDRGDLKGIDGDKVKAVLNTVARIGVINKNHFGGNSWHTPYGPICLHEQYIAQFGIAINDKTYLDGYQDCLDYYRDHAIKPDGRVWSRWAYTNEDMMPGEVTDKGFYEAQWGYLMDSNPDLVTNVSELYQQTGNLNWLRTHKVSCEKALDWLIRRDENKNGLVEMLPADQSEGKASDWIDIVWASYENAFVNAKLYRALMLWAELEKHMGDESRSGEYAAFAAKLAESFNKDIKDGGFWDPANNCYVHWRDKKGIAHGTNMVTPVNFMAIAYEISKDDSRNKTILGIIEDQMQKENLFFWPLCLSSYGPGELKEWQLPFPNYENGDIFLSWGSVAVAAYAKYDPAIAMKYIRKVLDRYEKDGLAFQRYGRLKQDGRGDDILSGNCTSVVGLYQSIYGINPMHNRFYLAPRITPELNGTILKYTFRQQQLQIGLQQNRYSVSDGHFRIGSKNDFGFNASKNKLEYFHLNHEVPDLILVMENQTAAGSTKNMKDIAIDGVGTADPINIEIGDWKADHMSWQLTATSGSRLNYSIKATSPGETYIIKADDKIVATSKADMKGRILFSHTGNKKQTFFEIQKK
ncbi:MAG: hypothetical protein EOO04_17130 [Chitinophagaceae bacterium]|nr:MAG: hypothetical protein EOO04_17130 [Chitinophagaceae bacterium]